MSAPKSVSGWIYRHMFTLPIIFDRRVTTGQILEAISVDESLTDEQRTVIMQDWKARPNQLKDLVNNLEKVNHVIWILIYILLGYVAGNIFPMFN